MAITLTWIGHATWLVDTGHGVLLIDPFFDESPTACMKGADVACDAILVTHGHADHVGDLVQEREVKALFEVGVDRHVVDAVAREDGDARLGAAQHGGEVAAPLPAADAVRAQPALKAVRDLTPRER